MSELFVTIFISTISIIFLIMVGIKIYSNVKDKMEMKALQQMYWREERAKLGGEIINIKKDIQELKNKLDICPKNE